MADDTTKSPLKVGYNFQSQNGNIILAMPDSISTWADFYTYTYTSEPNPILNDNLFLKDYDLSNIQRIGYEANILLPLFFNKNRTDSVKKVGYFPYYTFSVDKDVKGNPTLAAIYYQDPISSPGIRYKWKFYYK